MRDRLIAATSPVAVLSVYPSTPVSWPANRIMRSSRSERCGVDEPDRLHGTEAQRVPAAPRHLFDGHAPLEIRHGIEVVRARLIRGRERIDECLVLVP